MVYKRKYRRIRCKGCKRLFPRNRIKKVTDPYQQDINSVEVKVWLCKQCYQAKCDDI